MKAKYKSDKKCVKLSWDLDDDNADKVKIYRSLNSSFPTDTSTKIQEQDADDEDFNDCGVEAGKKYYYKVVVIGNNGEESDSEKVSVQIDEEITIDLFGTKNESQNDDQEAEISKTTDENNTDENEENNSEETNENEGLDSEESDVLGAQDNQDSNKFILFLKQWWVGVASFIALGTGWFIFRNKF